LGVVLFCGPERGRQPIERQGYAGHHGVVRTIRVSPTSPRPSIEIAGMHGLPRPLPVLRLEPLPLEGKFGREGYGKSPLERFAV
jgi:hypothetical protein